MDIFLLNMKMKIYEFHILLEVNINIICYIDYYQGFIADFVCICPKWRFTFADLGVFLNIKKFVIR